MLCLTDRIALCLLALTGLQAPPVGGQAARPPSTASSIRAVRDDLEHSNFAGALETLSKVPPAELSKDGELLTLRGIAAWGQALKRSQPLLHMTTEVGLVRRAYRSLFRTKQRYPGNEIWLTQMEAARGYGR